jgi:hypothetical protein
MGGAIGIDRNEDQWREMRACLDRARPGSPAMALGYLRAAFPEAALADRVRAFADWRSGGPLAA